jgi:hypothetical protein
MLEHSESIGASDTPPGAKLVEKRQPHSVAAAFVSAKPRRADPRKKEIALEVD